ncbi:iron uptake system protein EfeO [Nocardioides pocheonensis]|uniref:iron uptake system protein EfeO n=1 Tax=Nocardioides pocheonensis TaxID=661485 RepID=UPI001C83157B|nr:iron uptake system protein EfeO [Nocardioides pocheonensis]
MKILPTAAACALLAVPLTACSLTQSNKSDGAEGSGPITVTSSATACELSSTKAGSGRVTFRIKNTGSKVTEFYLYAEDGKRIVGEVENIGPGLTRDLVVSVAPGTYVTACKPGMEGDGIRGKLTVTDSGRKSSVADVDQETLEHATESYADYVKQEADALLEGTTQFVAAYRSGDDAKARSLYPTARQHWERIEPVAESFGDLDPKMDLREADLEQGQKWTGWHLLEKDLWPPAKGYTALNRAQRATYAQDLLANTKTLHTRVQTQTYDVTHLGNGSKELMDEVATGKITGEEEIWSHTDLWDFQANVDGARTAFELLEPILAVKDHDLEEQIDERFDDLQKLLDQYRSGDGFVSYDTVTPEQRKQLSDAVNALAEPLSKMTGAVTA